MFSQINERSSFKRKLIFLIQINLDVLLILQQLNNHDIDSQITTCTVDWILICDSINQ